MFAHIFAVLTAFVVFFGLVGNGLSLIVLKNTRSKVRMMMMTMMIMMMMMKIMMMMMMMI